jgi:hypothetical protein
MGGGGGLARSAAAFAVGAHTTSCVHYLLLRHLPQPPRCLPERHPRGRAACPTGGWAWDDRLAPELPRCWEARVTVHNAVPKDTFGGGFAPWSMVGGLTRDKAAIFIAHIAGAGLALARYLGKSELRPLGFYLLVATELQLFGTELPRFV